MNSILNFGILTIKKRNRERLIFCKQIIVLFLRIYKINLKPKFIILNIKRSEKEKSNYCEQINVLFLI